MFNQYSYKSVSSLNKSMKTLNSHIENINNQFTTGYKTKSESFTETLNGLQTSEHRDQSSGLAKKTERDLDFAISGVGFFEVQMPDGTLAYTRNGSLELNSVGELVTSHGYAITNKTGSEEVDINQAYDSLGQEGGKFNLSILSKKILVPTGETIKLGDEGALKDTKGNDIGELKLVTFPNLDGLKALGNGLFAATEAAGEIEEVLIGDKTGETKVKQGYLESSNMNMVREMGKIVQTNTAIKAHMKVLKMLDQMHETLNSALSRAV